MKIEMKDISDILIEAKKELEMSKEELLHKLWDTQDIIHIAIEYVKEHRYYAHTIDIDELLEILEGGENNR